MHAIRPLLVAVKFSETGEWLGREIRVDTMELAKIIVDWKHRGYSVTTYTLHPTQKAVREFSDAVDQYLLDMEAWNAQEGIA